MPREKYVWELEDFIMERANHWRKSAKRKGHIFDKFISEWVSFNIIFNLINKKYRDKLRLKGEDTDSEVGRVRSTVRFLFNDSDWSDDLNNSIKALVELDPPYLI